MRRILAAHADVARIAFSALAGKLPGVRYGLGGGNGLLIHEVTTRPTQDVDLFIGTLDDFTAVAALIDDGLERAGYKVDKTGDCGDLADWWPGGEETGLADREVTSPAGHVTELEIGHFDLLEDPVIIDGIPVAALDDLAGNKACALINRRQARDYADAAALTTRGYSPASLLALARQRDPGLDPRDVAAVGIRLDALDDRRLAPFLPEGRDVAWLREVLATWPRPAR